MESISYGGDQGTGEKDNLGVCVNTKGIENIGVQVGIHNEV